MSRDSPKTTAAEIDRFFGLEARFKDIGRDTSLETDQLKKVCQKPRGKAWRLTRNPMNIT